jgi:mannose-6-phosphate isomerase
LFIGVAQVSFDIRYSNFVIDQMPPLYPLKFHPVFKRYLWGGRRLGTVLGKPIGPGEDYAESWEVVDHPQGQSVVSNGPLAGTPLQRLVTRRGRELLGRHAPLPRFPLIFKYLDCQRDLSVQVHPDDAAAAQLDPPDFGKTEAWVVLDAQPGSRVFAGLKSVIDRETLAREVAKGRTELCLHSFEARAGQCIFIPAGTVHALGAGLLVAEIQQASDTTWRLFDWDRVGPDGLPRNLHIDESLAAIDYSARQVYPQTPQRTEQPHVERLVACDQFVLDRRTVAKELPLGGDDRFHILSVIEGEALLGVQRAGEAASEVTDSTTNDEVSLITLLRGQTVLVPACLPPMLVGARESAVVLDMYLP